jgi:micrococcal nuclease
MQESLNLNTSYQRLLNNLKKILVQGLRTIESQRIKTYWRTGQLISKYLLDNKQRARYGTGLFSMLSKDLNINERILYQAVKFYEAFPILNPRSKLDWTHYRLLLGVKDKTKRSYFQRDVIKYGWDSRQLQRAIRIYNLKNKDLDVEETVAPKLRCRRGRLYIYKLIKAQKLNPTQSNLLVDCGFGLWRKVSLDGLNNPQEGEIVESIKTASEYKLRALKESYSRLFTYKAFVERVVDADTIWVHIDLGFYNWSRQKIRFRGIDAPELSTQKGQKAKEFVESILSQVPFVIIKTYCPDKYNRYLSDVFYLTGEENPQNVLNAGVFLNQELLSVGLAKIV